MSSATASGNGSPNPVILLTRRLLRLAGEGNYHPRVEEVLTVLEDHYSACEIEKKFRKWLSRVRRRMITKHKIPMCSVSERFYTGDSDASGRVIREPYCELPPETLQEGQQCLPTGNGARIAGIYMVDPEKLRAGRHDYVIEASVEHLVSVGALVQGTGMRRAHVAITIEVLAEGKTVKTLQRTMREDFAARAVPFMKEVLGVSKKFLQQGELFLKETEAMRKEAEELRKQRMREAQEAADAKAKPQEEDEGKEEGGSKKKEGEGE